MEELLKSMEERLKYLESEQAKEEEGEIGVTFRSAELLCAIIAIQKKIIDGINKSTAIRSIKQLPPRMRGAGQRADEYTAYLKDTKIAILNDAEFDAVIDHNTKRMDGPEANAIGIYNEEEGTFLVIRESLL